MDVPWLMTVASDRRQYLIKSSWLNHHKIDFSLSLSLRKSGTHTKKSISSHELGLSINLLHRCLRVLLFFFSSFSLSFFVPSSCDEQPKLRIIFLKNAHFSVKVAANTIPTYRASNSSSQSSNLIRGAARELINWEKSLRCFGFWERPRVSPLASGLKNENINIRVGLLRAARM